MSARMAGLLAVGCECEENEGGGEEGLICRVYWVGGGGWVIRGEKRHDREIFPFPSH